MAWRDIAPIGRDFRFGCLRSLSELDVPGMLAWMHDPAVNRWFERDFSSMDKGMVLSFIHESWMDLESLHLAVDDGKEAYLGTVSLKHISNDSKSAEYAISMGTKTHGTGVATRATDDLLTLAREQIGLASVYLNVLKGNGRARAFYEKSGFVLLDEPPECANPIKKNAVSDLVWYSVSL